MGLSSSRTFLGEQTQWETISHYSGGLWVLTLVAGTLQPSPAPSPHFGRGKIQFCIPCWEDLSLFCIRNFEKSDPSLVQSQTVSSCRKVWPRGWHVIIFDGTLLWESVLLLFHTNYAYKPPSFILWLQASCFNYASCKYWPWFILSLSTYPWGFPVPLVHCFPQNLFHFCYIQDREGQNLSVRPVVLHSTMLSLTFLQISNGLLSFECCQALCPHICNTAYRELQFYFLSFNSWTRTCTIYWQIKLV